MQNVEMWRSAIRPGHPGRVAAPELPLVATQQAQDNARNDQLVGMLNVFRRSGGLARAQEVACRFKGQSASDVSPLAGWIADRQVISLEWQSSIWLPLFQFNPSGMTLRAGLRAVLAELTQTHDDWGVATWFAQHNARLAGCTPAEMLAASASQVLNAAFAERAAAAGQVCGADA